jgi:heat shock protein HslJ
MRARSVGRAVLLGLVIGCSVLAACARPGVGPGGSVSGPSTPGTGPGANNQPPDGPVGKFKVTEVIGHEIVPGSEIIFDFGDRLGIATGCNGMGGDYRIQDGRLHVDGLSQTLMACAEPLMAQERWIAAFVESLPDIHPTATGWTLSGRGIVAESLTLEPVRVAVPSALEGTTWKLITIIDGSTASSVPAGVTARMQIGGGRISLSAGCNTIGGPATVETGSSATEGRIAVGPVVSTRMACGDPIDQVEFAMNQTFDGTVNYTLTGERGLEITAASGRGLVFSAESGGSTTSTNSGPSGSEPAPIPKAKG